MLIFTRSSNTSEPGRECRTTGISPTGSLGPKKVFEANGTAERDAALVMLEQIPGNQQVTVGADKGYDTAGFVAECRNLHVTPHVAQNDKRPGGSAIDRRTTRCPGYAISQKKRKRIEECSAG